MGQIISSLCDCIKWLDDIPVLYQPTVPIFHCQQEREKLYVGAVDTHNFARIQTLKRAQNTDSEKEKKINKKKAFKPSNNQKTNKTQKKKQKTKLLPVPTSIFTVHNHSDSGSSDVSSVGDIKEDNEKLSDLFVFANKCLECIAEYVSYHDIQSTLSRAILPRLSKARSFWHKKYLI